MKIIDIQSILGPNIFHHRPVMVMTLDLEDLTDVSSAEIPGFVDRLLLLVPGLEQHRCSPGHSGGFVERLRRGTYFGHIVEHLALELSDAAGIPVSYGKTVYGGAQGVYKVVVRFKSEKAMEFLLRMAVEITNAVAKNNEAALPSKFSDVFEIIEQEELGPSTAMIVEAAEKRGIPYLRLNQSSLFQLGYGKNRKIIQATSTGTTGYIGVELAQDKEATKQFLRIAEIPVPKGIVVHSEDEAVNAYLELGVPVVVKPLSANQGKGVSLDLNTSNEVRTAYQFARDHAEAVIVEEMFIGQDYRMFIVGGKMIAAARREPASVSGDGIHTIRELIRIENENPLRGEGHRKPLSRILLDSTAREFLRRKSIDLEAIPPPGRTVQLRETSNLSTGGTATDVTDEVHPNIRAICERAARIIGLDICGIDLITEDITKPLDRQRGGIIEANACPGIRMHHYPLSGRSRDAGGAIVTHLFPEGSSSRIPIISITGTNGKTTVARLIGHILQHNGIVTGLTSSDGIYIDGTQVASGDTAGAHSARIVLGDQAVEAAVLETARGGIIKRGLGYDWSDVGILTNIQPDHIGQNELEDLEDILHVKKLVAERVKTGGTLILNADDPMLLHLPDDVYADRFSRNIIYFSIQPDNLAIARHTHADGTAYFTRNGWIYEYKRQVETPIVEARQVPMTYGGTASFQIGNIMAAIAACATLGLSMSQISEALYSFESVRDNRGRANLYRLKKGYLLVDYGHNPDAFAAIAEMVSTWNQSQTTAIIGVPGDRADEVIRMSGQSVAASFSKMFVREDFDLRGRKSGEVANILLDAILEANPQAICTIELDQNRAIDSAVEKMQDRELIVFFYDESDQIQDVLERIGAEAMPDPSELFSVRPRARRIG